MAQKKFFKNSKINFEDKEEKKFDPSSVYGNEQYINFGMYKQKRDDPESKPMTVYDIANKGDYKYLNWLRAQHVQGKFNLQESTYQHICCALRTWHEEPKQGVWAPQYEELGNGLWLLKYKTDTGIQSFPIKYKTCSECNARKNITRFDDNSNVCRFCIHKKEPVGSKAPNGTEFIFMD